MLARLILALLLAAFAVPAAAPAACHEAPTSASHAMIATVMTMTMTVTMTVDVAGNPTGAMDMPDHKAVPPHGCIGCIPPSNWAAARIVVVAPRDRTLLVEHAAVLDIGAVPAPALRPPRTA